MENSPPCFAPIWEILDFTQNLMAPQAKILAIWYSFLLDFALEIAILTVSNLKNFRLRRLRAVRNDRYPSVLSYDGLGQLGKGRSINNKASGVST